MKKEAEKKRRLWPVSLIVLLLLIAAYVVWALVTAIPTINPTSTIKITSGIVPGNTLPWPPYGESAIGVNNDGVIATHGTQTEVPTASTAKLITALCVLQKYPLSVGENGPTITITPDDVALYNVYQAEDGSDMQIVSGEQLSEYQMLEGILLPSADNIADSLAVWAFGSLTNYSAYANQYLSKHGLDNTHVGTDASGYSPSTVSTASDLVKLGELAMSEPVIAGIVAEPSASGIPVVGTIKNVNSLLGRDNIIGIKTGNTNQAGGVFLSASKITVNGQPLTIITSVMQAPTLADALASSQPLIIAAQSNFSNPPNISSINSGAVVGEYIVPWSHQAITAVASQPVEVTSWGGSAVAEAITLKSITYQAQTDQVVGSITTSSSLLKTTSTTNAILSRAPGAPSKLWILFHPESFIHI